MAYENLLTIFATPKVKNKEMVNTSLDQRNLSTN